jgi:outer membrane protein
MRKILVLVIILTGFYRLSAQQGFQTYSLKQAVEYGVQNSISAKNARLSEIEAKAHNHELLSIGLPQVNGNFDYQYYLIKPTSPAFTKDLALFGIPPSTKIYFNLNNNISTGVNLSQMIFDDRLFVGIKAFKSLINVAQLQTGLTEQEIRYNIIKSYCDVQSAKKILELLDTNLVTLDKLQHDTRETYKQGLIEETDVDRIDLGESQLKSQINNTKNLYDLALASLKYNMGLKLSDQIALTDNIESIRALVTPIAPAFDPSQRIENQLLQSSITLHSLDIEQKRAGYYPSLFALANLGAGSQVDFAREFFETTSNWYGQSFIGFTLKVPLYDGGMKEATIKQSKMELAKAKNDYENFQTQAALQVDAARTTFNTNLIEEENAKESMRLNDKIFGKTKIKFKEGVSSSFELITTQQDQTSNLIRYYTAIKNVLESRADLDKALGVK